MQAINRKTGKRYLVLNDYVINGTNAQDGQIMVMYCGKMKNDDKMAVFVRERDEFYEKFQII